MEFLKDYIDLIIFLILGIMAFIAFWCVVERMLFFRKINFKNYENQEQFDDAISENLTTIYIIYSNAPYIGLLGTVIGIMVTFYEMGLAGNIDVKSIVVGLSLALKATALGLLVAIPALMAYNALLRKVSLLSNAIRQIKMLKLPKNEGLNIVPFIDIMLVLLAIVLSISTFIAHGKIQISLPSSENATNISNNEKKLLITIDEKNTFYLNDKLADLNEVQNAIFSLDKKTIVELKSDKNAKFESFVKIIDFLKAKEHENFQILTEKNK